MHCLKEVFGQTETKKTVNLSKDIRRVDDKTYEEYKKSKKEEEEIEEVIYIESDELQEFLDKNCLVFIDEGEDEEEEIAPTCDDTKPKKEIKQRPKLVYCDEEFSTTSKSYISSDDESLESLKEDKKETATEKKHTFDEIKQNKGSK